MESLINNIKSIFKDADNAFSYCAMNFDSRMAAINEWNRLLCPENVGLLINLIEEQQQKIEKLEEEIDGVKAA